MEKSKKIASIVSLVRVTSPNVLELRQMANALRQKLALGSPPSPSPFNPSFKFESGQQALNKLAGDLQILHSHGVECVYLTLGALGTIVSVSLGNGGGTRYAYVEALLYNDRKVKSVVGAGDAFVAGAVFVLSSVVANENYIRFDDYVRAGKFGTKVAAACIETKSNALGNEREKLVRLVVEGAGVNGFVEITPIIAQYP